MKLSEIVKKLVGGIEPVGETCTDKKKFANLETHINLVEQLLDDLVSVSKYNKGSPEYSRNRAGEKAYDFLKEIRIYAEEGE